MIQIQTIATRLELYQDWLELRRVARSEAAGAQPLWPAITPRCDRIELLLHLDLDRDQRRELVQALAPFCDSRLANDALRRACSHLADVLGVVLSDPAAPLDRPRIDQITYFRLLQLALHIDENEHGAGEDLWARQLAARANVPLERVHAGIVRMLADGVAHLPAGDDADRIDTFRLTDPATAEHVLFTSDCNGESYGDGEPPHGPARRRAPSSAR